MPATPNSSVQASCCATFYEQDWVRLLAEDGFHPGGAELSRRTVEQMNLGSGARLLDVGCGVGTTASMLATELGLSVTGIDVSQSNLQRAAAAAGDSGVRFVHADAHQLPFADASFDGVLIECVLSLLQDKGAALGEIRRLLQPGGSLGITDMSVHGELAEDFAEVVAPWTCLADALDRDAYVKLFESAGFQVTSTADESASLGALVGKLKRKLVLVGAGSLALGQAPIDITAVRYWLQRFVDEVDRGAVSYLRFQLAIR
jgi:SAM-dependent methyltransferase